MLWRPHVEAFATWLSVSATDGTIRQRRHYLRHLAATNTDPWAVTPDDLITFIANDRWGGEARKSARSTVAAFYGWAYRTGRHTVDLTQGLPPVRVALGVPRPAPREARTRALETLNPRTRLMVLLACYAGLRCVEVARIHTDDIIDNRIHVIGKGRKQRVVPIHPVLSRALPLHRVGFLFPGQVDGHIAPGTVSRLLSAALPGPWTGHTLRHAFATDALAASGDLRAVQILLGHSSPTTTAMYTAVADARLAEVVGAIG